MYIKYELFQENIYFFYFGFLLDDKKYNIINFMLLYINNFTILNFILFIM